MRILTAITLFIGLTGCLDGSKDANDDTGTEVLDADADGISDDTDNCPEVPNDDQADLDGDGNGDVCDADVDGDTFEGAVDDCDDADAAVNPGADELCDTIDNNCDGEIDEDTAVDALTFYADTDADGHGDAAVAVTACAQPSGHVDNANDCNDADATISPDGVEVCDTADNNCDGEIDEDTATDASTWYADVDMDTYGDQNSSTVTCYVPTGYVANWDDCDDLNNAIDIIDEDGDGYNSCTDDCDDDNAWTHPGAAESDSATDCLTDADDDGWGSEESGGTDCDDDEGSTFPGAADLDSTTDCLTDADDDGWGSEASGGTDCDDGDADGNNDDADADGLTSCAGDCDDATANGTGDMVDADGDGFSDCYLDCNPNDVYTFPGAAELDSTTDCLTDADEDGYGVHYETCLTFEMYDDNDDSWDDSYLGVEVDGVEIQQITHVGGEMSIVEVCVAGPSDIDVIWHDGANSSDVYFGIYVEDIMENTWNGSSSYDDSLFDYWWNYYADGETILTATPTSFPATDCDDSDASIGATDVDADGSISCIDDCDDTDPILNSLDADGDGYTSCDSDCDDTDATINVDAAEVWYDGADQDCDEWSDYDADGDGEDSDQHSGTDCDDADADLNTADDDSDGTSSCGGDCDDWDASLTIDDTDADGVTSCDSDCDDNDSTVGATDGDSDGFFTCGLSSEIDCDDGDASYYPGSTFTDFAACLNPTTYPASTYDVDGDGYAAQAADDCYTLNMVDSWGDGWDGAYLSVYENGVWVSDHTVASSSAVDQVCASADGVVFQVTYMSGSYESEHSYTITGDTSGYTYVSDGPSPTVGVVLTAVHGSDSDDSDANVQ